MLIYNEHEVLVKSKDRTSEGLGWGRQMKTFIKTAHKAVCESELNEMSLTLVEREDSHKYTQTCDIYSYNF